MDAERERVREGTWAFSCVHNTTHLMESIFASGSQSQQWVSVKSWCRLLFVVAVVICHLFTIRHLPPPPLLRPSPITIRILIEFQAVLLICFLLLNFGFAVAVVAAAQQFSKSDSSGCCCASWLAMPFQPIPEYPTIFHSHCIYICTLRFPCCCYFFSIVALFSSVLCISVRVCVCVCLLICFIEFRETSFVARQRRIVKKRMKTEIEIQKEERKWKKKSQPTWVRAKAKTKAVQ